MTSIYPSSSTGSTTSSAKLLRVSGMASGIDTDAVVKSMVSNFQAKIDKANQAKQALQWKQEGYRDIIKGIKALQDYFDPISSKYILSGNSLNTNTTTSNDTSVVSATSVSTAKAGTYTVKVSQLADQAKIEGSTLNSMINVTDASKWSGATLTLGSTPITLDAITDTNLSGTTLDEVVANINSKIASEPTLNGTVSASYVNDGNLSYIKFTSNSSINLTTKASVANGGASLGSIASINSGISSTTKLTDLGFSDNSSTGNTISFTMKNGTTSLPVSLTVNSSSTVQDLMNQVNSATSGAVTMNINDTTGKISFQSKNYGATSSISITDSSTINNVITKLGISTTTNIGTDAIVAITAPGQSTVTTTQSSNKFTANGVNYNLVGVNKLNESSNVTVTSNSDTVVSNVKNFIEDYNTIVSTINTKLTEKKDNSYAPLTDEQKTSMSETQITAWEAKAKVGALKNDDYLSNLMIGLRGTLYSTVYNNYDSADKVPLSFGAYGSNAIGIETSTDYKDGGKLVLRDEAKLKDAIENHIDDFKKLFAGASSSTLGANEVYIGSKKYNEDGIFKRMDNIMREYVGAPGIGKDGTSLSGYMNIFVNKQYDFSSTGSTGNNTLPDQVYAKTLSISKFQTQLADAQTRYYAQFTRLETAMNTLNSQQSSLSSMFANGS